MLVPFSVIFVMFVGGVADWIWRRSDARSNELYSIPLASGLIAGEALIAVIIPLLVVLGHESCGAVTAAVQGGPPEGHIAALVSLIKPAVEKSRGMAGDPIANAVRANVEMVVKQLRSSTPILSELVAHGKLKIVGATYSIETGAVTWLPDVN